MRLLERAVFAPEVLVAALAVPGGVAARALDRVSDGGAELALSRTVVLATLARLVELFDHDEGALCRTALLLDDLGRDFGVGRAVLPRDDRALSGHLGLLCAVCGADALVAFPGTPGFGPRQAHETEPAGDRPVRFPLHATRLLSPREFARRAVASERCTPELVPRLERLDAIAHSLHPTTALERLPGPRAGAR